MLNLYHYLSNGRRGGASRHSDKRRATVRLWLEELEPRLTLSADLRGNLMPPKVTPSITVVSSPLVNAEGLPGQPLGFSPQQISQAYGFNQVSFRNGTIQGDGSGQTIAIVDPYDQPHIVHDLATFDSTYGLPAPPTFTVVNQDGGAALPAGDRTWGLEESLDVEWAHAMAPGANILLVEADSNDWTDLLTAIDYARNQPGVSVVSMSWGSGEWSTQAAYDSYFTTPTSHTGITFVAASGDSGSSGAPTYPSVSPNVLAVGGTQLGLSSTSNYSSETGWSGSGGGLSAYGGQPGYQRGIVTQSTTRRAVPDVAYNASNGSAYAIYDSSPYGGWSTVGGTSVAAPQWAALLAIANQGRALNGLSALDGVKQTLPALYKLPVSDFHDVTVGSNGAYSDSPGYDLVTGRGSPVVNNLVPGLVAYGTPIAPPPSPWIVKPASASPNIVQGRTASLNVQGGEDGRASLLTYTWWALSGPAGAPLPTYSINGTNAAQNTTVTFYKAGTYTLRVTVEDPTGKTVSSDVTITVQQTLTSVAITPAKPGVADGGTQQFQATALDQFKNAMSIQPTSWVWKLTSGAGSLSSSGLYTAPASGTGTATIQVTAAGLIGSASLTFGPTPAAPSMLNAVVISSQQVNLSWRDNSSNETGFILQRSTNGGSWTTIVKLGVNATSFSDKTVNGGNTYSYRVDAYNSFGNSAYSNTAGAVTPVVASGGVDAMATPPQSTTDNEARPPAERAAVPVSWQDREADSLWAFARFAVLSNEPAMGEGSGRADSLWLTWRIELAQNASPQRTALLDALWQAWGYEPERNLVGMRML